MQDMSKATLSICFLSTVILLGHTYEHSYLISQALDSVRRKRFLFEHPPDQPGPSHQTITTSSSSSTSTCSVCGAQLPADEDAASFHVANCLAVRGETNDSEDGSYEEYTWCNVTRVRATSLLSPQARASKCSLLWSPPPPP